MRVLKLFVGEFSFRIHYLGKLKQVQKVPIHLNNQQECIPVVCVPPTLVAAMSVPIPFHREPAPFTETPVTDKYPQRL